MLFCTDGCTSLVDKTTDPHCFVFYTARGGKTPRVTCLHLEKDRGELATGWLCQHSSGMLFYSSLETQTHKATVVTLLSIKTGVWSSSVSLLWYCWGRGQYRVQRHTGRSDEVFSPSLPFFLRKPCLTTPALSHQNMQAETTSVSCQGWDQIEIPCRNSGKLTTQT